VVVGFQSECISVFCAPVRIVRRMSSPNRPSDQELVDACLSGSATKEIWQQLFDRCHIHLLRVVRRSLGADAVSEDRVEEIVQSLWCEVVFHAESLLGPFDAARGTIKNYLGKLAWQCAQWHQQCRRRRYRGQEIPLWQIPEDKIAITELPRGALEQDFLGCLTPGERDFFLYDLHGEPSPKSRTQRTDAARWHLQKRIIDKWRAFWQRE